MNVLIGIVLLIGMIYSAWHAMSTENEDFLKWVVVELIFAACILLEGLK